MRELTLDELFFVSGGKQATPEGGGATSAGDKSGSGYGDEASAGGKGFSSSPGWGMAAGTFAGSFAGPYAPQASLTLGMLGHFIETRDHHKMGEEFKDYVHQELNDGNILQD